MADEIIKDAAAVLDAFTAIVSRLRSIEELACEVQSPYPFVTSRLGRLVGLVADQLAQACRDLDRYVDVTEYYCAHLERALDAHAGERLAPPVLRNNCENKRRWIEAYNAILLHRFRFVRATQPQRGLEPRGYRSFRQSEHPLGPYNPLQQMFPHRYGSQLPHK